MKILIVEDEAPAARRLNKLVQDAQPDAEVMATLDSVEAVVEWLETNPTPELIFMDIQLSDGLSFDIFRQTKVNSPVIFTTAFDEYAIKAFQVNSIDYLLKPIDQEALGRSFDKFDKLKQQLGNSTLDINQLIQNIQQPQSTYRHRFLIKSGQRLVPVATDEIAYFYAHEKMVYLITVDQHKYAVDFSLDELEHMLDPNHFFRANRQFIISMQAIDGIHHSFNGKLKVHIKPAFEDDIIVSREKARVFKNWLED